MSFFDRVFRWRVSPAKSNVAPSTAKFNASTDREMSAVHTRVEVEKATEPHSTFPPALLPEILTVNPRDLSLNPLKVDEGWLVPKDSASGPGDRSDIAIALDAQSPTDLIQPNQPRPSFKEVALLRLSVALREVLTQRLLQDLASAKLEVARLCGEIVERIQDHSTVPEPSHAAAFNNQFSNADDSGFNVPKGYPYPQTKTHSETTLVEPTVLVELGRRIAELESENAKIRNNEDEKLSLIRLQLEQQKQQLVDGKQSLEERIQLVEAQSRRLAEREATVYKNFSELQRREKLLGGFKRPQIDAGPNEGVVFNEEIRVLRAQIYADTSAAKRREAYLVEREAYLVEKLRVLKERLSADATEAFKMRKAIQEQLDQADNSIENLLKVKQQLESSLESERQNRATPPKSIKRKSRIDSTLISVSDQRIIDWMLEDASPEQAGVDHGYLSLIGEGPWPDHQIRELMEGAGFSLWMLPDTDVGHVVVGRHSWDAAALEQQIEAMEGTRLRIYSQEMWFAKLVTGRDPFDSGDHELLMAFARGHPALEYLIERDDPWPEVSNSELVIGGTVFTEVSEFGANSPLHSFGYQVGVSSGLSMSQRRALLARFLESRDLEFDGDASDQYRSLWGRPRSVQRLFRVAFHIRWLIGWQGKSPYRMKANEDWQEDLKWLKKTYYNPKLHGFRWPGV